ncbi:MAG: hypothetical protein ABEH77_03815, partial [Halobacteriaceae archaeon]
EDDARRAAVVAEKLSTAPDRASELSLFELYNPEFRLASSDAEQVFLDMFLVALLRDGFAHYNDSVSRIRVETQTTSSRLVYDPYGGDSVPVVYEGTPWRLTSEDGWLEQ